MLQISVKMKFYFLSPFFCASGWKGTMGEVLESSEESQTWFPCRYREIHEVHLQAIERRQVRVVERSEERSTSQGYPSQRMHSKGMYLGLQGTRILEGVGSQFGKKRACTLMEPWHMSYCGVSRTQGLLRVQWVGALRVLGVRIAWHVKICLLS